MLMPDQVAVQPAHCGTEIPCAVAFHPASRAGQPCDPQDGVKKPTQEVVRVCHGKGAANLCRMLQRIAGSGPNCARIPHPLPVSRIWHVSCFHTSTDPGGIQAQPGRSEAAMLERIFGVHEQSLLLRGQRTGVLASNLANADTPNYKARDLDFSAVLGAAGEVVQLSLVRTNAMHVDTGFGPAGAELKYRVPFQPSLDGNTVEAPVEQAAFADNAVRYQASLMFVNRRIASIESALTGQ
jgi:flagellar basal-body rod protein FlgB